MGNIRIIDRRSPQSEIAFQHLGGIKELVQVLASDKGECLHPSHPIINFLSNATLNATGVQIEVAMSWNKGFYGENILGFANGIRTNDGGSHFDGLKASISRTINSFAKQVFTFDGLIATFHSLIHSIWE